MKFRFCGDLDCPDWVLAEISVLSKMTSIKIRQLVLQIIKFILTGEVNIDSFNKLIYDSKFESSDIKASFAAISFILKNSTRYAVDSGTLSNELQQLGLPKDNSNALCKIYAENLEKLSLELKDRSLRIFRLRKVDWRVDYILNSNILDQINEPKFEIKLTAVQNLSGNKKTLFFSISRICHQTLLADLKNALKIMESTL